jgi:hypothetical protein
VPQVQASRAIADVRVPKAGRVALAIAGTAVLAVVFLARNLNFYFDEYSFLLSSLDWTFISYWHPVLEHWVTLAAFTYRGELAVFGLRTHLPFVATLALLNAGVALLLFALVRRRSGDLPALSAMALMLFMGQGYENIFQPYQITVVGSAFFGLGALWILEQDSHWRRLAGALALLAGLMWSGFGLVFGVAAAVRLAAERRWAALPEVLGPPVVGYAVWFVAFGSAGLNHLNWPHDLQSALSLAGFTARGIGTTFTAVLGLDRTFGVWGLVVPAAAAILSWRRRRVDSLVLASFAALGAQYVLIGMERSLAEMPAPRYLQSGAAFGLIVLADTVRGLPWRVPWRPLYLVGLAAAFTLSATYLTAAAGALGRVESTQDAELQTVAVFRGAPDLNQDAVVDLLINPYTTPRRYYEAVDRYGSPVPVISLAGLDQLPPAAVDQAMRAIFSGSVAVSTGAPPAGAGCQEGGAPFFDVQVASGGTAWLASRSGAAVAVLLWFRGAPPAGPATSFQAGQDWVKIHVPDTGKPIMWHMRLQFSTGETATVCTAS